MVTQYIIQRDGKPDLRFKGEKLGEVSSNQERERWTELALYKTEGGTYVCETIGHTRWEGETTRYSSVTAKNHQEIIDCFGHGWLAKELYDETGIEDIEDLK